MGCTQSEENEKCSTCNPTPPEFQKDLQIERQSIKVGIYKKSAYPNLVLAKIQNESIQTADFIQNLVSENNKDKTFEGLLFDRYIPVNYNFYINKNIRQLTEISFVEIDGISVVLYKDFGLHHFLFLNNKKGNLVLDPKFSTTTNGLNYKDKYLLFNNFFNTSNDKKSFSLITMVTPYFEEVMGKVKSKNGLRVILEK